MMTVENVWYRSPIPRWKKKKYFLQINSMFRVFFNKKKLMFRIDHVLLRIMSYGLQLSEKARWLFT